MASGLKLVSGQLENRDRERGRFAGSGPRLAHQIFPFNGRRNQSGLDRRRFKIIGRLERFKHRRGKPQLGKLRFQLAPFFDSRSRTFFLRGRPVPLGAVRLSIPPPLFAAFESAARTVSLEAWAFFERPGAIPPIRSLFFSHAAFGISALSPRKPADAFLSLVSPSLAILSTAILSPAFLSPAFLSPAFLSPAFLSPATLCVWGPAFRLISLPRWEREPLLSFPHGVF